MDQELKTRLDKMRLELRRGLLVLAVLGQLKTEHYGYSLRQALSAQGIDIEEGTLYPLIRRLEEQGLLTSNWQEAQGRKRRYYKLSADGEEALAELASDWSSLTQSIEKILEKVSWT